MELLFPTSKSRYMTGSVGGIGPMPRFGYQLGPISGDRDSRRSCKTASRARNSSSLALAFNARYIRHIHVHERGWNQPGHRITRQPKPHPYSSLELSARTSILVFHHKGHEFCDPVTHGSLLTHTEVRLGTEKVAKCIRRIATDKGVTARNGLDVA